MMKLYVENVHGQTFVKTDDTVSFVYAHGLLRQKAGYDIVSYTENDPFDYTTDRVEDVIAVLPNGEEIMSRLFFWHSDPYDNDERRSMARNPVFNCHGLIVALEDKIKMKDARKKYNERRKFI